MKVFIDSSVVHPHRKEVKYQGIERLCREFSIELTKQGHQVTVTAPEKSEYPENIKVVTVPAGGADVEQQNFKLYQELLVDVDVIHSFSHFHAPAVFNPRLPVLSIFWHDPYIAKFPEPSYNMVALSEWGTQRFRDIYRQEARYQESIVVDMEIYKPISDIPKTPRFLSIGLMAPSKGHLEAIRLCRKTISCLDVVGGGFHPEAPNYANSIKSICDGKQIRFWGEVDDATKLFLLKSCKALLYTPGIEEVHSHKSCEALACGTPVITYNKGCLKEVVGNGGRVVDTEEEFIHYMGNPNRSEAQCREWAMRWEVGKVVSDYVHLYQQVADGLRW